MKFKSVMPGRKILELVRVNEPRWLQRPWFFCGFVVVEGRFSREVPMNCAHGGKPSPWVGLYELPSIKDGPTFSTIYLKPLVSFFAATIWIGQCPGCERVCWMMDGQGRKVPNCILVK